MAKKDVLDNVKKYVAFLKNNGFTINKVFIFGSYAKDDFNENSDIDIALVLDDMKNSFFTQVKLMKLRRDFDLRIEPHPFREEDFVVSHPFAGEIIKTGIQIA